MVWYRRGAWVAFVVSASAGVTDGTAQISTRSDGPVEVGLFGAGFVDYPSEFADDGCQRGAAALGGEGRYWPARWLGVELGGLVTFSAGTTSCYEALTLAPIPLDTPYPRTVYGDELGKRPAFDSSVGVVLEPFRGGSVSPRVRLGAARDWTRELGFWFMGAGVRFPFGRHALLMDMERRKYDLERFRQTVILRSGASALEVLSSETETVERIPWMVRVGWSWSPGGG